MNRLMMCILPAAVLTIGHVGSLHMQLTGEGMPFPQSYTVTAAGEVEPQINVEATDEQEWRDSSGGSL
jgi:hypothetical protein